ncbi:MAG: LysR family transcriptional regulator [Hyphomicrobiales bacterium]|nr:LysR family transcriptional regulator [Hyphomicrobiales bacterium]
MKADAAPRVTLRLDFGEGRYVGHGKVRLLEEVAAAGSISAAARAVGMSYRRAWLLIDELNRMFGRKLVEAHPGGRGVRATLTPFGARLVADYRGMEADAAAPCAERMAALARTLAAPQDG